jgi:RNA polymerase sigma-70 factor (ECF subfamily)
MMSMDARVGPGSEEDVAERAGRGDRDAMDAIYRRYHPPLLRLCRQMVDSGDEAADAAQEIFLRVLRVIERFDRSRPFRVWIYAVARNVIVDHLRRRGKWWDIESDLRRLPPDYVEEALDPVLRGESKERLRAAVQRLPGPYRLVILYAVWNDFAPSEIAELLDVPAGRVRVHLFRALKMLEKELGAE